MVQKGKKTNSSSLKREHDKINFAALNTDYYPILTRVSRNYMFPSMKYHLTPTFIYLRCFIVQTIYLIHEFSTVNSKKPAKLPQSTIKSSTIIKKPHIWYFTCTSNHLKIPTKLIISKGRRHITGIKQNSKLKNRLKTNRISIHHYKTK